MAVTAPLVPASSRADQIIAATRALFVRYGYRRTSVDDIAREAGVAKATLYLHFSGKEEMFREMIARFQRFQEERCAAAEAMDAPVEARVIALIDAAYGTTLEWFENTAHIEELRTVAVQEIALPVDESARQLGRRLARMIERAEDAGELRPPAVGRSPQEVARVLLFAAYGAKHATDATLAGFRAALPGIVRLILGGLILDGPIHDGMTTSATEDAT
ncbi:TetR/AcrR family transcriptional regulator [Sphingobium sp. Sx8-8]|uniref:TetR/AcrR family transcriptional regulator n=1 Tax=Sphingobium sp. Sx8-8 TaxID=2933617 RepID=UPI001F58A5EA|nr:TetR/AcrR family transcriptional regulator [Sphingobium sp. Sx8-8]